MSSGSFWRRVRRGTLSSLMYSSFMVSALSLVSAPINARIYHPEDYGKATLLSAVASIFSVVAQSSISMFIYQEGDKDSFSKLTSDGIVINGAYSILVASMLMFYIGLMGGDWALMFVPVIVFVGGSSAIFSAFLLRASKTKVLGLARFATAIVQLVLSVILGLAIGTYLGLVISSLASSALLAVICLKQTGITDIRSAFSLSNWESVKRLMRSQGRMVAFTSSAELVNSLTSQAPVIFIERFFGTAYLGYYSMATRLLSLPTSLVIGPVGEWFRQAAAAKYHDRQSCRPLILGVVVALLILGLPFAILAAFFAPDVLAILLSEKWRPAGAFAQTLVFLYYIKAAVSPVTFIHTLARVYVYPLILDCALFIATVACFAVTAQYQSIQFSLGVYAITYGFAYIIPFTTAYYFGKRNGGDPTAHAA